MLHFCLIFDKICSNFYINILQYVFAGSRTFMTKMILLHKKCSLFRMIITKLFITGIKISLEYVPYRREYLKTSIFFSFGGLVLHKKCSFWILRDDKCKTKVFWINLKEKTFFIHFRMFFFLFELLLNLDSIAHKMLHSA